MPVSRTKLKCIYCNKGLSSRKGDHIPPKSFFPEKPGHSLMQVPCCQECNRKYSVSDEKVRELIAVMDGVNDHPVVKAEILPAVFRGWEKAEGRLYRFMNEVIDWSSLPQDLPSFKSFQEMPISLRTRPELTDFCGRMARALLYEQHKVRTDAKTKFKWGFADFMHPDDIVYLTSIKPPRVYGDEVFSYCVHVNPLNLVAICWVQFYKQVEIVTVVALNEVIRDEEDPSEMAERLKLSYKYDTTFPGWKSLPTLKKAVFIEKTLGA